MATEKEQKLYQDRLKKLENLNVKFNYNMFVKRVNSLKPVWKSELKSFILGELPEFDLVKSFVTEKIKYFDKS